MSTPLWILLAFAAWTLVTLIVGVGLHRWSQMLTRRAEPKDFRAEYPHGTDLYRRGMRAHANCVENLPLYGAVVLAMVATGVEAPLLDHLAITLIVARVIQTTIHIVPEPTNAWIAARFTFFFTQLVCIVWMGVYVALHAA